MSIVQSAERWREKAKHFQALLRFPELSAVDRQRLVALVDACECVAADLETAAAELAPSRAPSGPMQPSTLVTAKCTMARLATWLTNLPRAIGG